MSVRGLQIFKKPTCFCISRSGKN